VGVRTYVNLGNRVDLCLQLTETRKILEPDPSQVMLNEHGYLAQARWAELKPKSSGIKCRG
jgi:hypothetical protein